MTTMGPIVCLLVTTVVGLGCVRTTSLGRANGQVDAQAAADATDAHADRDSATPADRDATPASDAAADLPREAPIIGGGRDAIADGPDGPGADGGLDGP